MEKNLSDLYDSTIIAHNKTPFNFGKRADAQHILDAYNPLCGDKFKLFFDIEQGKVAHAAFHGYGCAVSKAATSVLIKKIEGLPVAQVLNLTTEYFKLLSEENTEGAIAASELNSFEVVKKFPERLACATLSWEAARDFFKNIKN